MSGLVGLTVRVSSPWLFN